MSSSRPNYLSDIWVIGYAKDVLRPYRCEWGACSFTLNSWSSYQKHAHLHCKQEVKRQAKAGKCRWRACLSHVPSSVKDLLTHVESSHLARLAISCPFKGCSEMFSHHQILAEHFFGAHKSFQKDAPVDIFLPCARKAARLVSPSIRTVPPLPSNPVPTLLLNESLHTLHHKALPSVDGLSQSQNAIGHRRKRRQGKLEEKAWRQVQSKRTDVDEESEDECEIGLSRIRHDAPKAVGNKTGTRFAVRRRNKKTWDVIDNELATPPVARTVVEADLTSPPLSFGFNKVKEMYDTLVVSTVKENGAAPSGLPV